MGPSKWSLRLVPVVQNLKLLPWHSGLLRIWQFFIGWLKGLNCMQATFWTTCHTRLKCASYFRDTLWSLFFCMTESTDSCKLGMGLYEAQMYHIFTLYTFSPEGSGSFRPWVVSAWVVSANFGGGSFRPW